MSDDPRWGQVCGECLETFRSMYYGLTWSGVAFLGAAEALRKPGECTCLQCGSVFVVNTVNAK